MKHPDTKHSRCPVRRILATTAGLGALCLNATAAPNIIFVLLDDAGYGDIGSFYQQQREAAGNRAQPWHFTPELDRLAEEGLQMRQHYCPAPLCGPSRASLLMGVHQGHANVRNDQNGKAMEDNWTVPRLLKQAGYATAMFGKHGLEGTGSTVPAMTGYPTRIGFDEYLGQLRHADAHNHYPHHNYNSPYTGGLVREAKQVWHNNNEISADLANCYSTDLYVARAKKFLVDHTHDNPDQPIFLYLPLPAPHAAFQVPTMAYPDGAGLSGGLQWLGTPGRMINTATGPIDSYIHPDYRNATYDHDNNAGTPEIAWPEIYQRFATMIRRVDDGMGDLRQTLIDLGIDDNTVVIFSSDNGPTEVSYLGESPSYHIRFLGNAGPLRGAKRSLWEGGVRMPTLAWGPGLIPGGRIDSTPSQFHDWMPTFADLAGIPAPARTDGVSLVPTLTGSGTQTPSTIYSEWRNLQMVHYDGWKGFRANVTTADVPFEIYDLASDIGETTNLAARADLLQLQQAMMDHILRIRRPDPTSPRPYDSLPGRR